MPFPLQHRRGWSRGLAAVWILLLAACSPHLHLVPIPPSESVPHTDPRLDAQLRLLQEAHRAHAEERYRTAALLFQRFVDSFPRSPQEAEARWWLARSYESAGDLQSAIREYRTLAAAEPASGIQPGSVQSLALRRLNDLRQGSGRAFSDSTRVVVGISRSHLPARSEWQRWLHGLAQAGVTALAIEAAGQAGETADLFGAMAPIAHAESLTLLAIVDLHQPAWLTAEEEWLAKTWDAAHGSLRDTGRPDVSHPGYQAYVEKALAGLSRTGIDGLLIRARPVTGFAEEFSSASLRAFQSAFGLSLDVPSLFLAAVSAEQASAQPEPSAAYWRWAGWKTRQYLGLVGRIAARFRENRPAGVVALEIHTDGVSTPVQAQMQYGEDMLDAKQRNVDLVMLSEPDGPGSGAYNGGERRLAESMGNHGERLWAQRSITPEELAMLPTVVADRVSAVQASGISNLWLSVISAPSLP